MAPKMHKPAPELGFIAPKKAIDGSRAAFHLS